MALMFSIVECGISSTMKASSKKQTSYSSFCTSNYNRMYRCAERIDEAYSSADKDDACNDCRSDLEDYADRCFDSTDREDFYDLLEEACGAVVIGMSLFSIIVAVLVAVTWP